MVLVRRVAHHLMKTRRIQIAQQPPHDVRVMQTGVAGKVIARGHRLDGDIGSMQADRAHVRDGGSVGQVAVTDAVVHLIISLVHERACRPELQIGLRDEAMHDLTFVQTRGPEGAARRRRYRNQLVECASGSAYSDAAVLLGHVAERWKQIRWSASPRLRLQQVPHESQIFRKMIVLDREVARARASQADHAAPIVMDGDVLDGKGGEHDDRTSAVLGLASLDNCATEHPFRVTNAAVEPPAAADAIILPIEHGAASREERDRGRWYLSVLEYLFQPGLRQERTK